MGEGGGAVQKKGGGSLNWSGSEQEFLLLCFNYKGKVKCKSSPIKGGPIVKSFNKKKKKGKQLKRFVMGALALSSQS